MHDDNHTKTRPSIVTAPIIVTLTVIVLTALGSISASHTDTADVRDACGEWLRGMMIGDMVLFWVFLITFIAIDCLADDGYDSIPRKNRERSINLAITITAFIFAALSAIICGLTFQTTAAAQADHNCTRAISDQPGEIAPNSQSRDSPLAIVTGYFFGIAYTALTVTNLALAGIYCVKYYHS